MGIHDPRVDIARHRQIEEIRAVLGVVEFVSDGLVDGNGDRFSGRIRFITRVDGEGFVFHGSSLWMSKAVG